MSEQQSTSRTKVASGKSRRSRRKRKQQLEKVKEWSTWILFIALGAVIIWLVLNRMVGSPPAPG